MPRNILFFADRLPPLVGGMEMHAKYFIDYFGQHSLFPLSAIVSKDSTNRDILIRHCNKQIITLESLSEMFSPDILFFNSGCWIEELEDLRQWFPHAKFIYRTGGNEILKAPLIRKLIPEHDLRQKYWVETLNRCLDLLITNSAYTECRLRTIGMSCPFERCVGGVNSDALKPSCKCIPSELTIFCAARFVPYKNHSLVLSVVQEILSRGHAVKLRLAGEGPLLSQIKQQAVDLGIDSVVEFLGALDHEKVCHEIASAHLYMQFSKDHLTQVPGGSYIHSECMGRSILEAVTAGTYIIAGRSGALEEIVTPARGLLVDLDRPAAIVDQIETIIQSLPERLPVSDDYSWEKVFKHYEQILQQPHEITRRKRSIGSSS